MSLFQRGDIWWYEFWLTWAQIQFAKGYLVVGRCKTEAGEGRTIPLNSSLLPVLREYASWYRGKFGETRPEWYVFPFGKPRPSDPSRPITTFKTACRNVRKNAKVTGRWHDNRHTLITDLAESGAGDQTIMDIAGHVSKRMLRHYSHIRMEANGTALESIVNSRRTAAKKRPAILAEMAGPKLWGTHKEHKVIRGSR
jgi:integrase